MVKRIDRLTPEQIAMMPAHRDKWIKLGLSTEPMEHGDRYEMEKSIRFYYRRGRLPEPKVVIFVPSPFALRVATGIAGGAIWAVRNGRRDWHALEQAHAAIRDKFYSLPASKEG